MHRKEMADTDLLMINIVTFYVAPFPRYKFTNRK
jgi:hypothetical protein